MVTTRSAAPGRQRITWATGGHRVVPDATLNSPASTSKKSSITARQMSKKSKNRAVVTGKKVAKTMPKIKNRPVNSAKTKQVANNSVRKITPGAEPKSKRAGRVQVQKNNPTADPPRRSTRLAQRTADPNISPAANEDLPIHPTGDMPDVPESTSHSVALASDDEGPISSTHSTQNDILPTASDATTEPATIAQNESADADTMQSYMVAIRRRIDAMESRELLLASINAPYWSDELHRDLLKEVVKAWSAISVGRFKDINEVIQLPLEHMYWTEEIRVTQSALRDAGRYYDGLKQEAIDQKDEEMEEKLQLQ